MTWRAKYCPLCTAELVMSVAYGRERQRCGSCEFVMFVNPVGAAGAIVVDASRQVLLVRRALPPHAGRWALPAGYQEIDESPTEAAEREVREETGVRIRAVALLDLVFVPDDPRKPANVAFYLAVPELGSVAEGRDDVDAADWFELDALPPDLAFEGSRRILDRLRTDSHESRAWWAAWLAARPRPTE